MATESDHLVQAQRNEAAARLLAESGHFDWAVTTLFYAALHLIQAYFVREGIAVENHRDRDRQIRRLPQLRVIHDQYRVLRVDSENARYECRQFSKEEEEHIRQTSFEVVSSRLLFLLGVA